jgi:UDP-2,3-diacylglucosamine pyrophosphatase LpxH
VPGGGGVSLIARYQQPLLGLDAAGTSVFLTDWHLVPLAMIDDWPIDTVCHHPVKRLASLIDSLVLLKQQQPGIRFCHVGDLIDLWRSLDEDTPIAARVARVWDDYEDALAPLRDDLHATFIIGNHDERIREDSTGPLAGKPVKRARINGAKTGPYLQRIEIAHGHEFDGIEGLPDGLKEWGVRQQRKSRPPKASWQGFDGPPPGALNPYIGEDRAEGQAADEHLGVSAAAPLDLSITSYPRVVHYEDDSSANPMNLPGVARPDRNALEKFYGQARLRMWMTSTETERTSVMVIGHTHRPRIVWGTRPDGRIFVLMDCGSWRGQRSPAPGAPAKSWNAQVGVISGNDLRIYQLTYL